ncbi:MAG TPA: sulfotransferase [Deltaproteobacteria bacterium]|nr:sulfotransferase [Deltaproteobacteria bacterium]
METVFGRMRLAYRVSRHTFRVRVLPLFAAWMWLNIRIVVAIGQLLDPIFFPKLRRVEVKRPIVLVGNPRTGTTFLQRFLSEHGYGAGNELYRMLYASLLLQTIIKPFLPILEAVSPARYHKTPAHDTSLDGVETDDVALLFRYFDGFFLYGFFLAFAEEDLKDHFDPKHRDVSQRDFDWLEAVWKRSLVGHGSDTVIAKLFSLGPRLPQFLERFPEARVLYMARDPLNTIPSGMSLVSGVLDKAFGFWSLPEEIQQRWLTRLYRGLVDLQLEFTEQWNEGKIDRDRVYVVRYDRMMADFDGMMAEMHTFLGEEPTEAQQQAIDERAEKQRAYKSGHKYDLSKFGLDADKIREDCAPFYETFLPPLGGAGAAGAAEEAPAEAAEAAAEAAEATAEAEDEGDGATPTAADG